MITKKEKNMKSGKGSKTMNKGKNIKSGNRRNKIKKLRNPTKENSIKKNNHLVAMIVFTGINKIKKFKIYWPYLNKAINNFMNILNVNFSEKAIQILFR
jgi:hypothetical protein